MSLGLVGRKVGMTRVFTDDGAAIPVTVLDVANNRVTQIKTPETDGYSAVQVTYGKRRASRVTKPVAGHLAKAGVESGVVRVTLPCWPAMRLPGNTRPGSCAMPMEPGVLCERELPCDARFELKW